MYHFEACNLVVVLLFVYAAFRRQVIPPYVFLVLTITSFTPFVLNDFLFPASYMPDQSMYLEIVQQVRSFDFAALESSSIFNIQVKTAALLFAFRQSHLCKRCTAWLFAITLYTQPLSFGCIQEKTFEGGPSSLCCYIPVLFFIAP